MGSGGADDEVAFGDLSGPADDDQAASPGFVLDLLSPFWVWTGPTMASRVVENDAPLTAADGRGHRAVALIRTLPSHSSSLLGEDWA